MRRERETHSLTDGLDPAHETDDVLGPSNRHDGVAVLVDLAVVLEPGEGPAQDVVAEVGVARGDALVVVGLVGVAERLEVLARDERLAVEHLEEEGRGRGEEGGEGALGLVEVAGAQLRLDHLRARSPGESARRLCGVDRG